MGKSAPKPTPPKETSAATTGSNVSTAVANSFLQNMNEITPDGTRTFSQTGETDITDPYTGQTYNIPRFTVEQTLSEGQQAIKDQSDAAELNLSTLANNQSGFLNEYMGTPFSYQPGRHEAWAGGLYDDINSDALARDRSGLETRLANQGIALGSDQYNTAMENLTSGQQNARDRFMLDSFQTGFGTAQATRNQPINEITALLSGSQVSEPRFSTSSGVGGIQGTDNGAIIANHDAANMDRWRQNQASRGGFLSGLGGLFAGF